MEEMKKLLDLDAVELNKLDFPVAVMKVQANLFEALEGIRNKKQGFGLNVPSVSAMKKAFDYIAERTIEIFKQNIIMNTKITEMEKHGRGFAELAEKISGLTLDKPDRRSLSGPAEKQVQEEFPVIITMVDKQQEVESVKDEVKRIWDDKPETPRPSDVVMTKAKQMIIKMRNSREALEVKETLMKSDELKEKIRINTPTKRRARVMILSVEPEISEERVAEEIAGVLEERCLDWTGGPLLRQKLKDLDLPEQSRKSIEDLCKDKKPDFKIVRKISTKLGKINWVLDVDVDTKEWLLSRKRICFNFTRYRIVEYVNIIRCFRCQAYGHMSGNCSSEQKCPICSGDHRLSECKSVEERCANCYFAASGDPCDHRADSSSCPVFQEYRNSVLPKRL